MSIIINMKNILITVAAGTVGAKLVDYFLSVGFLVVAIDRGEHESFKIIRKSRGNNSLKCFFWILQGKVQCKVCCEY